MRICSKRDRRNAHRNTNRQITKYQEAKRKKKKEVKPEKPKDFTCQISIHQNTKEEIIELPGKPEKEIVELYEEPEKVTHKKKVINWKNG